MKILIVDDETSIRTTLQEFLGKGGHETHVAASADEALRILDTHEADLVLSDIVMPRVTGVELLKSIKDRHPRTHVILMTGEPTVQTASDALRNGAFDYLCKPFSLRDVAKVIANAARVRFLEDEQRRLEGENRHYQDRLERLVEERTRQAMESREDLQRTQEQLLTVMQTTPHGLCLLTSDWEFEYVNPALGRIVCPSSESTLSLIGRSLRELFVHSQDFDAFRKDVEDGLKTESQVSREIRMRSLEGGTFWCQVSLGLNVSTEPEKGIVATLTDTSMRKEMELELEHRAYFDDLTGLPNRAMFISRLQSAIDASQEGSNRCFAVLYLDIDRFKNVNDSYGHSTGDELLVDIARRLKDSLRPGDIVARLGGDEFAVLLERVESSSMAYRIAERIHRQLMPRFTVSANEFYCSASIGIVLGLPGTATPEEYLRNADIAMYRAKGDGRGSSRIYDDQMHVSVRSLLELETDLRKAIENHEFLPYYQPIVRISDCTIIGFEVLARWRHPRRGLVSPGEFIPLAEDSGLISDIGNLMLDASIRHLAGWNGMRPKGLPSLTMNINVSGKQLVHRSFVQTVKRILADTSVPGEWINLEITESVIMQDTEAAGRFIRDISELGVRVYIDDFGTGYSSLSYLQRFPVHAIKVDRSFIQQLPHSEDSAKLVRAIIALGINLGLSTVAEGIEREEQREFLLKTGCGIAQGYLFSKPVPYEEAQKLAIPD